MSDDSDFADFTHWNYRLVRVRTEDEELLELHEVYWNKGVPVLRTKDPVGLAAETEDEMLEQLERIRLAITENDVLEDSDFSH